MYLFKYYSFMQIPHYITPEKKKRKDDQKGNQALLDKQFILL